MANYLVKTEDTEVVAREALDQGTDSNGKRIVRNVVSVEPGNNDIPTTLGNEVVDTIVQSLPDVTISNWAAGPLDIDTLPSIPSGTNNIGSVEITGKVDVTDAIVTVTDNGAFGINSLPSLPAGSNNIGSIDVDSLPLNLITNNALDVNTSGNVRIEANDSLGNGVQPIQRIDGEKILKVANVIEFDHDWLSVANIGSTLVGATASAVTLKGLWAGNIKSADPVYLHIYEGTGNTAGSPDAFFPLPAESGGTHDIPPKPLPNGFQVLASKDPDSVTAPTEPVNVTFFYR